MVLITPCIDGGLLKVTFPTSETEVDAGCAPFAVPLHPSQEVLDTWKMQVTSSP